MSRRGFGSVLLIAGLLLLAGSAFVYQDIRSAQREMLAVHEASAAEVNSPAVLQEANANKEAAVPIPEITADKPATKREDYQSGQMTIAIPKLKVNAGVVKDTSTQLLKRGPGLYENSPLPDKAGGNVCIAAHRTTYGAWFRNVDQLEEGDEIILNYNGIKYTYLVQKVFIVDKKDWSVIEPQDYSAITLTSCHPLRSSKQRIVVRGKLIE